MKETRVINPELIEILSIKTLEGNIHAGAEADLTAVIGHNFNFELGTAIDAPEKIAAFKLTVQIDAVGAERAALDIKGSYTHEIIFRVENLDDFLETKEGENFPRIDLLLAATLVGIAYSTVRGIIFTRTQGTSLNAVVLPVVDPKKIMGIAEEKSSSEYLKKE